MTNDNIVSGALMADAHTGYTAPIGSVLAEHYIKLAFKNSFDLDNKKEELIKKYTQNFIKKPNNDNIKKYNKKTYEDKLKKYVSTNVEKDINQIINIKADNIKGNYSFDVKTKDGKDYIRDLNFALDFALENRKEMLFITNKILNKTLGKHFKLVFKAEGVFINRNHNHAELNNGLWIHRKGATHAEKGMYGVIPGNMRDGSFIVKGKGNKKSLYSSSHGAGRVYSRTKAKKEIKLEDFKETMIDRKSVV